MTSLPDYRAHYQSRLQRLNEQQRAAVEALFGPVLVLAGPGAGKTEILALRIAHILQETDTPPEAILAITYTDSGGQSMRRRLQSIIGEAAYRVQIHTFHSLCLELLQRYPEHMPRQGSTHIDELERYQLVERLLKEADAPLLRPFGDPYRHVRGVVAAMGAAKRDLITPAELGAMAQAQRDLEDDNPANYYQRAYKDKKAGDRKESAFADADKKRDRLLQLADVYAAYEAALADAGQVDYDDMITLVAAAVTSQESLRQLLAEKYLFILADEFQDTSHAQLQVLFGLGGGDDAPNIFAVGDDDQSIYGFQGARRANIRLFTDRYPSAQQLLLTHNYRSTPHILQLAGSVIAREEERTDKTLTPSGGHSGPQPLQRSYALPEIERSSVAEEIAERIAAGQAPETIAVLARRHSDAKAMWRALATRGVPCVYKGTIDLTTIDAVAQLLAVLRYLAGGHAHDLFMALHTPWLGLQPQDIWAAQMEAKPHNGMLLAWAHATAGDDNQLIPTGGAAVRTAIQQLERWRLQAQTEPAGRMVLRILQESRVLPQLALQKDVLPALALRALQQDATTEAGEERDLKTYLQRLEARQRYGLQPQLPLEISGRGVHIGTLHWSKGQEWDTVYLLNASDDTLPGSRRSDMLELPKGSTIIQEAPENEERRLLYVGITRARRELLLSHSSMTDTGKQRNATRFLVGEDIAPHLDKAEADTTEQNSSLLLGDLVATYTPPSATAHTALVAQLVAERRLRLTPSAVNHYLECPRVFFYRDVLRVPDLPTPHTEKGTYLHAVFQMYFDEWNTTGNRPGAARIEEMLLTKAADIPASEEDRLMHLREGRPLALAYLQQPGLLPARSAEKYIMAMAGEVPLGGFIDKVETAEDRSGVNIVDYKTGRYRAVKRDDMHDPDADYYRQLLHYALLWEKARRSDMPHVASVRLDFLKGQRDDGPQSYVFTPTADELQGYTELLQQVWREIADGTLAAAIQPGTTCQSCRQAGQACPYAGLFEGSAGNEDE